MTEKDGPRGRPYRVVAAEALVAFKLKPTDIAICRVLLDHANRPKFECFVGTERIATQAGVTSKTVRTALKRIAATGAISFIRFSRGGVDKYGRGIAHHFRLDFALNSVAPSEPSSSSDARSDVANTFSNPEHPSGLGSASAPSEPGKQMLQTRKSTPVNPEESSGEASIHEHNKSTSDHAHATGATPGMSLPLRGMDGCSAGHGSKQTIGPSKPLSANPIHARLTELGVRGRNLDRFMQSGRLTLELIDQVWLKVQYALAVRNRSAYFAKLIADELGVDISGGAKRSAQDASIVAQLEQIRRRRVQASSASGTVRSVGEVVRMMLPGVPPQ
jgi:hypothetical protein